MSAVAAFLDSSELERRAQAGSHPASTSTRWLLWASSIGRAPVLGDPGVWEWNVPKDKSSHTESIILHRKRDCSAL